MRTSQRSLLAAVILLACVAFVAAGCGPGRYYNKGVERYNEQNYDKALSEFRTALEKDTKHEISDIPDWIVKCYLGKAKVQYETDIYAAVESCERAVQEAENLKASAQSLALAKETAQKYGEEQTKRAAEAQILLQSARDAIQGKSDLASYESAHGLLARAVQLDPRKVEAQMLLHDVEQVIGKIKWADGLVAQGNATIADESKLTLKDVERAGQYYKQALLSYDKCDAAKKGLERTAALSITVRDKAEAHFKRALELEQAKDWPNCVAELQECIRLDYTHTAAADKLVKMKPLEQAEIRYNGYMAQIAALKSKGIKTVEDADAALKLCDQAIAAYEYNDGAKAEQADVKALRAPILADAIKHYDNGMAEKRNKNYEKAADEFRACLAIYANHPDAARELKAVTSELETLNLAKSCVDDGNKLLAADKPYEAQASFKKALELVPDMPAAVEGMAKADERIKQLKAEAAIAYGQAEQLFRDKKYEDCLAKIDEAIKKDPTNEEYKKRRAAVAHLIAAEHAARGKDYEKTADWDKALAEYKIAASYDAAYEKDCKRVQDEKAADLLAAEAETKHVPLKQWYDAASLYKEAMDLSTSRKIIFEGKMNGMLTKVMEQVAPLENEGRYDEALALLDKIVALNALYPGAKTKADTYRAALKDATTRYDDAKKAMGESRYIFAKSALSAIVTALPKYKDAADLLKASEAKIVLAQSSFSRAEDYETQKKYDTAVVFYDDCAKLCADYPDAAKRAADLRTARKEYDSGVSLRSEKKLEEALAAFTAAAAIRADFEDVQKQMSDINALMTVVKYHYGEGVAAQGKKDWDFAIKHYEEVLKIIYKYSDTADRLEACKKAKADAGG